MAQAWVYEDDSVGWRTMVNGDLPNSGVTAATYGDASHVAQVAVNAQGIVTSASNVAISGASSPLTTKGDIYGHSTVDARIPVGADNQVLIADSTKALGVRWDTVPSGAPGSGLKKLFSTTLSGIGALDTGASGIAAGHGTIYISILCQSSSVANDSFTARINGDTGANYDAMFRQASGTQTFGTSLAQTSWTAGIVIHGTGNTANYASAILIEFPFYDQTTFNKTGWMRGATTDGTSGNNRISDLAIGWRSTAAINQFSFNSSAGLSIGSSMTVYGTE